MIFLSDFPYIPQLAATGIAGSRATGILILPGVDEITALTMGLFCFGS